MYEKEESIIDCQELADFIEGVLIKTPSDKVKMSVLVSRVAAIVAWQDDFLKAQQQAVNMLIEKSNQFFSELEKLEKRDK